MPNQKKVNSSGQNSESGSQAFNEQDHQAEQTEGAKSIGKDPQSTGQDRNRMSKMGLKKARRETKG